jgi:hypothetical protein
MSGKTEMFIEFFKLFAAQPLAARREALKTFDRMLKETPPDDQKFFKKLRFYLAKLINQPNKQKT